MALTFAQAQSALASGSYITVDSIVNLVKDVSGAVEGATSASTYLLFNGTMPDIKWGQTLMALG